MDKTKKYRPILKVGIFISLLAMLFFIAMLYSDNFWPLLFAFGILGCCVLPLLPIMMENCAETTYPIPEELSNGVMFVGSNLVGLAFIFILQGLLSIPRLGPPPLLPSNIFILGIIVLALILLQFYSGAYKRHEHEHLIRPLLSDSAVNPMDNDRSFYSDPSSGESCSTTSQDIANMVRVASSDNSSNIFPSARPSSSNTWNVSILLYMHS